MADSGSPARSGLSSRAALDSRQGSEEGAGRSRPLSVSEGDRQGGETSPRTVEEDSLLVGGGDAGTGESDMEVGETSGGAMITDRADPLTSERQTGGMGYQWSEEVANHEDQLAHREGDDAVDEDDAASELSEKGSESGRGREQRRGSGQGNSPRRLRAPPCERKPSERAIRQFLSDPFTKDALYPGLSRGGSLPDYVRYLPDEKTGKPQHSYECDSGRVHTGTEPCHWMGQGPSDTRASDKTPELRWEGVQHRVHNLGHNSYPRLCSGVTVPVTSLPHDRTTRSSVQMLYIAYLQAGMRCPVRGCEPWAAVDAPSKALPQPQAMWTK